ncbi:MAG TPA: hypothetical protein PLH23_09130 [Hyphomonadaceae bacterium]|nr:hypothetical protein [Hyphomonadaceae bacterium]HPI48418.1 hypothetical protein [Hyphomonadaceae bacterium]
MKRFVPACLGLSAMLLASGCAAVESLDTKPNTGPCPVAGVLYDASRLVEIDGAERHENVGFTGAVEGVRSFCRYTGTNPIDMEVEIDFAFGKGPKATASSRTYPVFVTVTRRDRMVLAKERFDVNVTFPPGTDIVRLTEKIPGISIPRANETVSGTNFEVIVGFDLTPEQVAYNRSGTRFTINVAPPAKPK